VRQHLDELNFLRLTTPLSVDQQATYEGLCKQEQALIEDEA
jgi:hypothetical protein